MPDISLTTVVLLCLAALAAGWIDAVVGGGGLLLLPALLLGLPAGTPAAHALGTNKAVAIVGTTGAAVTYARKAPVDVRTAVRIGLAALAGSSGGAFFAAGMSTEVLKPVIMVVLLAVAALRDPAPRLRHRARHRPGHPPSDPRRDRPRRPRHRLLRRPDRPRHGTFLVLALTALLHLDLVTASATAKIVNCCTNAGALATFAWQGAVLWQLAVLMAAFNLAGGMFGAHTALKKGSGFVRVVLLTVVFALVANLAYEQWVA
ncbi:putative membrane protein YfcA [Streptomyces ambofaciens]